MSSSNTNNDLINALNNASNALNAYLPIFIYIFGIVGNLLNIFVLSHRTLRSNPSAVCLLVASIAGLIAILSGLTSRMMAGYANDLTSTIDWICKVRNWILYSSRTINLVMISLAAIDRWLSTSADQNFRKRSNLKYIYRSTIIVLVYTCILNTPIIYCYQANLVDAPRQCYGSSSTCRLTTDLAYAFGTTLLPLIIMLTFGWLTVNNVHRVHARVIAVTATVMTQCNKTNITNKNVRQKARKIDRSLLKMLLIQVILLFMLTCPHGIQKLYSSFSSTPSRQSVQNAIENLLLNIFTLLAFIASGMPFYIYTLSGGNIFRNTLVNLAKTFIHMIICHHCQ